MWPSPLWGWKGTSRPLVPAMGGCEKCTYYMALRSDDKEIVAKGPLHETIQPAKSHKNAEGILKNNYKETVNTGTEAGPEQVHVCVGCTRVPPQAESRVFNEAGFSWPGEVLTKHESQEKVVELQLSLQEGG